ncbi:hypothetical protein L204_101017 [Cryptococcus depauperatus]|nr:translocation protein SEC63 [Cryptococcus depauperatus CBS 7855]
MPGISYDDSGSLASYFGVTCLTLFLIPSTYFALKPKNNVTQKPLCPCPVCKSAPTRVEKIKRESRKSLGSKWTVFLLCTWILLGYLVYNLAITPKQQGGTVYNPFEILGLSSSSTEKEIKKHYKKLSLKFHPDKLKLAEGQTAEEAEEKYIEITKAYKSLTDEVTRDNLAKYGNPDGPQQREDKIAIPQWVIEGSNGLWILAAYGLVLGGGIPWIVGRWWFTQRRLTRDNILNATAEHFFHGLAEDTDFINLIALLAGSLEVAAAIGAKTDKKTKKARQLKTEELVKTVEMVRAESVVLQDDPLMKEESKVAVKSGVDKRARALILAHLLRIEIEDADLRADQLTILRILPSLLTALNNIALAHNWLNVSLRCFQLQPALVQALPPDAEPLAQLPGVGLDEAFKQTTLTKAEGTLWLEKWARARDGFEDAFTVAKYWPRLEIVDAKYTVADSKIVTPGSIVTLVAKLRYVYPTTPLSVRAKPISMLPLGLAKQQNANGSAEGEVKEAVKEVRKKAEKTEETTVNQEERKVSRYVHAPHWPQLCKPHFYFLLGDTKLNKVIVPPVKITDIPLPSTDGTPSSPKEFTLTFQAPPQANLYSFVIYFRSDSLLGADLEVPLMLKIENPQDEVSEDEDISEPEEDSLAGQMAMMRGQKVKSSLVRNAGNDAEYESSSDEYDEASSSEDEVAIGSKRQRAYNEDSSDSD